MPKVITFAVLSDLHYKQHGVNATCRPSGATEHGDPIEELFTFLRDNEEDLQGSHQNIADYLLCPGDICDQADSEAFKVGWEQLKRLREQLGASTLIASTGNHEVDSRADPEHQTRGNSELHIDPIGFLQGISDYPSPLLQNDDRRWVYWGRGYEIIERPDALILLVNSSHYHNTTQPNEYERGRFNDAALDELRTDLKKRVDENQDRLFVALLHHHPIPHDDFDVKLGRIEMFNGQRLMLALKECPVAWLVIHGHKHFPRLVRYDNGSGPGKLIVLGAASAGTNLDGYAHRTSLQFYLIDAVVSDQQDEPTALGTLRAYSWSGTEWKTAVREPQGLPNGCGYNVPELGMKKIADEVKQSLSGGDAYSTWEEIVAKVPSLGHLLPSELQNFRRASANKGIVFVWNDEYCLPIELGLKEVAE